MPVFTSVGLDIPYWFDYQHKLDIWKHAEVDTNSPPGGAWVWVYFHGGGMTRGSKEQHGEATDEYLPWYEYIRDLTSTPWPMYLITVNWRAIRTQGWDGLNSTRWASAPGVNDAWQRDVQRAIQWIKGIGAQTYGWNSRLVVVGGPSAGGAVAAYGAHAGSAAHSPTNVFQGSGYWDSDTHGQPFGLMQWGSQCNIDKSAANLVAGYLGVSQSDWDDIDIERLRRQASATRQAIARKSPIPTVSFGEQWALDVPPFTDAHGLPQAVELHDHLEGLNVAHRMYFPDFDPGYTPGSGDPPAYAINTVVDLGLTPSQWPSSDIFTFFTDLFEAAGFVGGSP